MSKSDPAAKSDAVVRTYLIGDAAEHEISHEWLKWQHIPRRGDTLRLPSNGEQAWPAFLVERIEWRPHHTAHCHKELCADLNPRRIQLADWPLGNVGAN